jgi:hypothetical protein
MLLTIFFVVLKDKLRSLFLNVQKFSFTLTDSVPYLGKPYNENQFFLEVIKHLEIISEFMTAPSST